MAARNFVRRIHLIPALLLQVLVRAYQLLIAPFCFGCCRFTPSCSHYAQDALQMHPLHRAVWLIARRVVRCNPWGATGYDPVPAPEKTHMVPK